MSLLPLNSLLVFVIVSFIFSGTGITGEITNVDIPRWIHHETSAQMTCTFDASLAQLSWSRTTYDDIMLPQPDNELLYYVFSTSTWSGPALGRMTGEIDGMSSTLTINYVDWQLDDGKYWCSGLDATDFSESSMSDNTTVSVSPDIVQQSDSSGLLPKASTVSVVKGIDNVFSCDAKGSKPPAALSWILDGSTYKPSQTDSENVTPGLWDTTSSFTLSPEERHHNQQLQCLATVPGDASGKQTHVIIDLKVPPEIVQLSDINEPDGYDDDSLVKVDEGQSHTFTCTVYDTRPAAQIEWQVDDAPPRNEFTIVPPLTPTPSDQLVDSSSTLSFTPARDHHRSTMECMASIDVASTPTVTRNIVFDVYGSPDKPTINGVSQMTEDVDAQLSCEALDANPEGDIKWYIKDMDITQSPANNNEQADNRYDINSNLAYTPKREHNEQPLKCRAEHQSGNVETTVSLDIQFCSLSATLSQCPINVVANATATLQCVTGTSYPMSSTVWSMNSEEKETSHPPEYMDGNFGGQITSQEYTTDILTKEDNGATVTCCARNDDITCDSNVCSTPCILNVQFPAEISTTMMHPDLPIQEGSEVSLTCTAIGNPQPDSFVYWTKKGSSEELNDVYSDATSVLHLPSISRNDAGVYECIADNDIGDPDKASVDIPVQYSANISNKRDNYRGVNEGKTAYLDCIADGLPDPTFAWYDPKGVLLTDDTERVTIVNDIERKDGVLGTIIHSQLQIASVSGADYGDYMCEVTNTIQPVDSFTIHVNGTTKPSPVVDLAVVEETLESILIEWIPGNNGGEPQTFIIDYRETSEAEYGDEYNVGETETRYAVEGLLSNTNYSIRVRSENVNGRNENGRIVEGTTIKGLPKPPKDVRILPKLSSRASLTVQWTPGDPGYEPQWFLIDYRRLNGRFTGDRIQIPDGLFQFQVTDLQQGVTYEIAVYSANVYGVNEDYESDTGSPLSPPSNTGLIVGSVFGAAILAVIIAVLIVYLLRSSHQNNKENHNRGNLPQDGVDTIDMNSDIEILPYQSFQPPEGIGNPVAPDTGAYENYVKRGYAFPREQLTFVKNLGSGEFGEVKLALAKGIMGQTGDTKVAVKTIKDNASDSAKKDFEMELGVMQFLMSKINTRRVPNVIQLLGCCTEKDPQYMILEYMERGDLKTFLRKSRLDESKTKGNETHDYGNVVVGSKSLSPLQLITFAKEVASGMAFIARQQCIHRDLAARNVLLDEQLVCKVSDFGLAKDVMGTKVYRRSNEVRLPVRWMAYESILGDEHTIQSDVWSFGVLLWEIVTLGGRPYPRMKGKQIRDLLKTGNRMTKPNHCSQELYEIMRSCWDKEPSQRPTFEKLIDLLDELTGTHMGYLSLAELKPELYEDKSLPAPNEKV